MPNHFFRCKCRLANRAPWWPLELQVLINAVVPAVVLGLQAGSGIQPGSSQALAANVVLLVVKACYALYMTAVMPYINVSAVHVELEWGQLGGGRVWHIGCAAPGSRPAWCTAMRWHSGVEAHRCAPVIALHAI